MASAKKLLTSSNQLQFEVDTDDQWLELVSLSGLIVVDIYSELCGPCAAMVSGVLRKAKIEFGGDHLVLATAKSDTIECLERFRNKSMPTWMFIANGFRVRLLYGANAPLLYQIIKQEFDLELNALQNLRIRVQEDFDQLLPEEVSETREKLKIKEEYERVEKDRAQKEYRETRMMKSDYIMSNIYNNMKPTTLILLYPHVLRETQTIAKYLENNGFQIGEKATVLVKLVSREVFQCTLTQTNLEEILFFEESELVTETLMSTPIAVILIKTTNDELARNIERSLKMALFEHKQNAQSFGEQFVLDIRTNLHQDDNDEISVKLSSIKVPGIWLPSNRYVTGDCIRVFFPKMVQSYLLPDPEPKERYVIVAFDTCKMYDLRPIIDSYQGKEIPCFGFFLDFFKMKPILIANSFESYESQQNNLTGDQKLVLKVGRTKDEPLLTLGQYSPVYISPNLIKGEQDCEIFLKDDCKTRDDSDQLLCSSSESENEVLDAIKSL